MAEIKFAIEGEGAIEATEELLALEGIEGSYAVDEEIQRGVKGGRHDRARFTAIFEGGILQGPRGICFRQRK